MNAETRIINRVKIEHASGLTKAEKYADIFPKVQAVCVKGTIRIVNSMGTYSAYVFLLDGGEGG